MQTEQQPSAAGSSAHACEHREAAADGDARAGRAASRAEGGAFALSSTLGGVRRVCDGAVGVGLGADVRELDAAVGEGQGAAHGGVWALEAVEDALVARGTLSPSLLDASRLQAPLQAQRARTAVPVVSRALFSQAYEQYNLRKRDLAGLPFVAKYNVYGAPRHTRFYVVFDVQAVALRRTAAAPRLHLARTSAP